MITGSRQISTYVQTKLNSKYKNILNEVLAALTSIVVTFGRTRRLWLAAGQTNRLTLIEIVETVASAIAATIGEGLAGLAIAIVVVAGLPLCAGTPCHRLIANV